jgi:predicted nucleic acid-binding Zn ribbon protein
MNKHCKKCGKPFHAINSFHIACSPKCARILAQEKRKKRTRENKKLLRELKPYSWHAKKAQSAFNKFIRARDKAEPCISCGRHHNGQYHAGHYITVGARPELRFHPMNAHKQCSACNNYLSGNLVNYRVNLIKKIGIKAVEYLEGYRGARASVRELGEIEKHYKQFLKEMEGI